MAQSKYVKIMELEQENAINFVMGNWFKYLLCKIRIWLLEKGEKNEKN
jgi:hypothetical protein